MVSEEALLPRRAEILRTIREHRLVSFDFIQRRFLSVSPQTIHHDLKKLQDNGFIIKKGVTRGALYAPRDIFPSLNQRHWLAYPQPEK